VGVAQKGGDLSGKGQRSLFAGARVGSATHFCIRKREERGSVGL